MATQSILRNGLRSPATAAARIRNSKEPSRSILKRPAPLTLSPNALPFQTSVTISFSPTPKSAHVHFPPSPSLFATFSTHSPNTYDRAPIIVSPNSLAIPSWGDRVYSPSLADFKLTNPPRPVPLTKYLSPTITEFEDPRSPKAGVNPGVRLSFAPAPRGARGRTLGKALASYPRSPYPSAPITPGAEETVEEPERGRTMKRGVWPKDRERGDMIKGLPARARARAKSLEQEVSVTTKISSKAPRQPKPVTLAPAKLSEPIPSPLVQSQTFLSPVPESGWLSGKVPPHPLDLETPSESSRLSQAFWQSVSLEESPAAMNVSLSGPTMLFGNADGEIWSPCIPKITEPTITNAAVPNLPKPALMRSKRAPTELAPSSLLSPGHKTAFMRESVLSPGQKLAFTFNSKSDFGASPSPNDPMASFPSFGTAMTMGEAVDGLRIPERAALA